MGAYESHPSGIKYRHSFEIASTMDCRMLFKWKNARQGILRLKNIKLAA